MRGRKVCSVMYSTVCGIGLRNNMRVVRERFMFIVYACMYCLLFMEIVLCMCMELLS